jgi:para-aminobenzoate synthetase component 1
MQLIEQYERFKRGAYSGSIGYVNERGDFDMNVVIRSVLYDSHTGHVSVPVGSALTIDSLPSGELEECRAKIEKIKELVARSVVMVG